MFSFKNFFNLSSFIFIVALTQAQQQIWELKTPHLNQYQSQQLQPPYFTQFNMQQQQPFNSQQSEPSLQNFQQQFLQQQLTPSNYGADNLRLLPGVGSTRGQNQHPIFEQISSISSIPQQQYNSRHQQQDFLRNVNQKLPQANSENPDGATITQQELSYKSVHYSFNSPISQGQYAIQQQMLNKILQQFIANNGVSYNDYTLQTSQLLTPIVENIRTAPLLSHEQGQQQFLHNVLLKPQQQQHYFTSGSQSLDNMPNNGVLEKKTSQFYVMSYDSDSSDDTPPVHRPQNSTCDSCCDDKNSLCRTCCNLASGLGVAFLKGASENQKKNYTLNKKNQMFRGC